MKRIIAVIMIIGLLFSAFAEVSRPSLDGRAKVADVGELPVGLFAKSASFLPGDTVIVTNPATKISIEVMIFGNIGSSEGIAVVLSPEAARELYITKGSNVIVKVTKKSDTYTESSILSKTLQTYTPVAEEEPEQEPVEPEFDTPSEASEEYVFYTDPDSVIADEMEVETETELVEEPELLDVEPEPLEPAEEVAFEEPEWPSEVVETEPEPLEPAEEVAFEEPEWPAEVVEVEPEPVEPAEEVAFEEPEWPSEVVDVEPEPLEPAEEVAFEEPEWPEEEAGEEAVEDIPLIEEEPEIVYVEEMDDETLEGEEEVALIEDLPEEEIPVEEVPFIEEEPIIEYVEVIEEELPEENENFIEETETVLIPAEPNPPSYESIIQEEPEVVIIPVFEEESELVQDSAEPAQDSPEDVIEVVPVLVEEPEVSWADIPAVEEIEIEPEVIVVAEPVPAVEIPYGEIEAGKWYIQIATCSKLESVENIVSQYGKKYPLVVVKLDSGDMRVLVGSLSSDEYPTILARFKAYGFKDAFARSK